MEAVIDEALGYVVDGDAGRFLERAQIQDALVGDAASLGLYSSG